MNQRDKERACDALMDWFDSQDITPPDAIEVMVMTIVLAIVSMVGGERVATASPTEDDFRRIREGIDAVIGLLPLEFYRLQSGNGA